MGGIALCAGIILFGCLSMIMQSVAIVLVVQRDFVLPVGFLPLLAIYATSLACSIVMWLLVMGLYGVTDSLITAYMALLGVSVMTVQSVLVAELSNDGVGAVIMSSLSIVSIMITVTGSGASLVRSWEETDDGIPETSTPGSD